MTTSREIDPARGVRPDDALRIFCLLPTLNPYGGVISVINLLNILIDRGHAVTLASLSFASKPPVYPRTEPVLIEDPRTLTDGWSPFDVLIATSWETAEPIAEMSLATDTPSVYFVQDFEPDFYREDDPREALARATYDMIDTRIVKTRYLKNRLETEGGWKAELIPPGMDLDIFYPRTDPTRRPPSVIAMARPDPPAEHRGFDILQQVYAQLGHDHPDLRLLTFGTENVHFDVPVDKHGQVSPDELPQLYSTASIYLDVSRSHGFGRTGIEAMACGTAAVLSDSGGISEYAVDGRNCLIIPTDDRDGAVDAVQRLLNDDDLRLSVVREGRKTALRYPDQAAADALATVLKSVAPPLGDSLGAVDPNEAKKSSQHYVWSDSSTSHDIQPARVLIVGWPKTGTTALYYLLAESLSEPALLFEPKDLSLYESLTGSQKAVVKALFPSQFNIEVHDKVGDLFTHHIWLVRDPRDFMISQFLYNFISREWSQDETRVERALAWLRAKEANPAAHPVWEVFEDPIFRDAKTDGSSIISRARAAKRFLEGPGSQFHVLKYEDLVDGHLEKLAEYLGFPIAREAEVPPKHSHVARSKRSGNWRHWFTLADVARYKEQLDPILEQFGYEREWTLAATPVVDPSEASDYVIRMVKTGSHS